MTQPVHSPSRMQIAAAICLATSASLCASHVRTPGTARSSSSRARDSRSIQNQQAAGVFVANRTSEQDGSLPDPQPCTIYLSGSAWSIAVHESSVATGITQQTAAYFTPSSIRTHEQRQAYQAAIDTLAAATVRCLPQFFAQKQWDDWSQNERSYFVLARTDGGLRCRATSQPDAMDQCIARAIERATLRPHVFCSNALLQFPPLGHVWVRRSQPPPRFGAVPGGRLVPEAHVFHFDGAALMIARVSALDWFQRQMRASGIPIVELDESSGSNDDAGTR